MTPLKIPFRTHIKETNKKCLRAIPLLTFIITKKLKRTDGLWSGSVYFAAIGIAFMFIEIPWIQKSILYLGHPSYSTSVVLASILLGAGLGSMTIKNLSQKILSSLLLLLPVFVFLSYYLSIPVFKSTLGLPLYLRIFISIFLLFPVGFLMGLPFASGMISLLGFCG